MADILLVNIDGGSQDRIPALLRQIGCDVALAGDREETIGLASGSAWDLIVLDVDIPDQQCLEICQEIKEITTTIPLVILSNANPDESLIKGFSAGADGVIIKPVAVAVFAAQINALLRRARWAQQEKEAAMEQGMDCFDWAEMEGLSPQERIMLTCSFTLQDKRKHETPPYEMFRVPGGAYLVKTPRVAGIRHINLVLYD